MNPGPAPAPPTGPRSQISLTSQGSRYASTNLSNQNVSSPSIRTNSNYSLSNQSTMSLSRINSASDPFLTTGIVKQGMIKYKEEGFTNIVWKTKWVVLRQNTLEFQKSEGGKISFTIILAHVVNVSRYAAIPLCIELIRAANPSAHPNTSIRDQPSKAMYMKFDADEELYEWQDNIYQRCPAISGVSAPTNMEHRIHVGYDPQKGGFTGLPPEWERLLTTSALTKDDVLRNPQAVIEVLQFYTNENKQPEGPDFFPTAGSSSTAYSNPSQQFSHGSSIAPPRPAPPQSYGSGYGPQHQQGRFNTPPRSQVNTSSGSYNVPSPVPGSTGYGSQASSNNYQDDKMSMDPLMRSMMEEEAKRIKESQERDRERQRQRQAEQDRDRERERRELEDYNASIPQQKMPSTQQELGGYSNTADPRYNPARTAPSAPASNNSRQPQQGSLRQPMQATRAAPPAPINSSNTIAPPKAPFAQNGSSSRDQSPSGSFQQNDMRHPSPNSRAQDRGPSPHTRVPNNPPASRIPGPVSQPKPLNVNKPNGVSKNEESKVTPVAAAPTKTAETRQKEVRMSSMSESEVMAKLKKIVTRLDPNDSYSKQKKIGQGASGSVYIAKVRNDASSSVAQKLWRKDGDQSRVAIKTMDLRHQPRKELIVNEILVMKESIHPNIVNYLDSFLIENDSELWVIMEYMSGGSLTDVIENNSMISEDQIAAVCNEV